MFEDSQVKPTASPLDRTDTVSSKRISAPLTPSQLRILKSTVPLLRGRGEEIARLFYDNMLKAHPQLHNIFNRAGQTTGAQPRALARAVLAYASHVDDLGQLEALVERIANKHVSLTVQPEQYEIVGKYLIESVAAVLGDSATIQVADAWKAAYTSLANIFITREREIYAAHTDWCGWRPFRIAKKIEESASITSFYLVPEDGQSLPSFRPGQYISLRIFIPQLGYMQPRQYSLSDAPRSEHFRVSVKGESGTARSLHDSVSTALHDRYMEGDVVELTHPTGDFWLAANNDLSPIVLISAGVGVTPLMSILNSIVSASSVRPVTWIQGAHNSEMQAFGPHISEVCSKHSNIRAIVFLSRVTASNIQGVHYHFDGRVRLDKVDQTRALFLDNSSAEYYVCGPTNFMQDVHRYLCEQGVNMARIHTEVFGVGYGT